MSLFPLLKAALCIILFAESSMTLLSVLLILHLPGATEAGVPNRTSFSATPSKGTGNACFQSWFYCPHHVIRVSLSRSQSELWLKPPATVFLSSCLSACHQGSCCAPPGCEATSAGVCGCLCIRGEHQGLGSCSMKHRLQATEMPSIASPFAALLTLNPQSFLSTQHHDFLPNLFLKFDFRV